MSRTKRSTRKFKSRKQNNHRQKKTRHTKYRKHRKHGKISERNKSKRKSRKIFWGGAPNQEQREQHLRRYGYIKVFLNFGNTYTLFRDFNEIKFDLNLKRNYSSFSLFDELEHNILDKLRNIISNSSNLDEYNIKIDEYFDDIDEFPLFDEIRYTTSIKYTTTIKMLEKIIDNHNLIDAIDGHKPDFPQPTDIDINDIDNGHSISYVMLEDGDVPIIKSFIHNDYKYYLTLYTWLYKRSLTQEEKQAEMLTRDAREKQTERVTRAQKNKIMPSNYHKPIYDYRL